MPPSLEDCDTIIVKGEEASTPHRRWSRASSPASMSPAPPRAGFAAAQASSPRRLQSPGPLDDDVDNTRDRESKSSSINTRNPPPPSPPPPPPAHAHDANLTDARPPATLPPPTSNKRPRPNALTTEERLLAMPEKRPMPWRPGVDAGADIETGGESRRKQIRFGCLLATRGDVVPTPCVSCANGRGKFSVCVADPSLFRGACAGCQLSGRPNRCSIKQSDDAQSPTASTPDSASRNVKKKVAKSHSPLTSNPDQRQPDEAPTWHTGSPQWPHEYGVPQAHPQTENAAAQPRWATVNPPPPSHPPHPPQPVQPLPSIAHRPNGIANFAPSDITHRSPMGWATINQQRPQPVPPPSYGMESNGRFPHRGMSRERREDTGGNDSGTGALIDTLPKNKQRQVYGVLSGLQAGIEHLQRELDALKRTMGVEDSD